MEHSGIASTSASNKRSSNELVDPDDGLIISSSKKSRIEPDNAKKIKCLKFILRCYEKIHAEVTNKKDPQYKNINLANQISNIMYTMYNIKRQRANGTIGNAEKKVSVKKTFNVTSKGQNYIIGMEKVDGILEASAKEMGLEFKRFETNSAENWYGTVAPYLDFFVANGLRMNELRIGHGNMPISKEGDKQKSFPVEKYGLNGSHHVLLEGSTFSPDKKGTMAQSLGPMTTFLLHVRTEEKYRKKWTDATKRAMAHIPMIDDILEVVKGKKATEVRNLISILADILLITTGRQAHRMFFPVNFLYRAYSFPVNASGKIVDGSGFETPWVGGEDLLKGFNVSGNGGMYLYQLMVDQDFELEGPWLEHEAQQILFHCIMGTYKEDLTILEQITTLGTWSTREQFGKKFQQNTMCGESRIFRPVPLRYYSKLTSANITGLLSSSYSQVSSIPVMSGNRIQNYTEEFFEHLSRKTSTMSVSRTIPQLTVAMTDILGTLRDELIKNGKKLQMGTVSWRSANPIDITTGGEELPNLVIEGRCKFFLGKSRVEI